MNDKELLMMAAKSAGISKEMLESQAQALAFAGRSDDCWSPLTDDGDALRLARERVTITPQELGEHLAALTDAQFDQVMQLVLETSDERLQYAVRELVCAPLVNKRVKELMK